MKLNIIHLKHRNDRLKNLIKELDNQSITEYLIWDGVLDLENPSKGISLAHKQIVQMAQKDDSPSVLIAEDDIKFTSKGAFKYYLVSEPKDYDLYLGGIYYGNIKSDNSVEDFAGLTLYMIHSKFYETFLSIPDNLPLDRGLIKKGFYQVCIPFVATQYNGYSDNKKAFRNYDIYLKGRELYDQKYNK
jgi:hypothetical protein